MTIKSLRPQPLLAQPDGRQSPWAEVTAEAVGMMRQYIADKGSSGFGSVLQLACSMKELGIEVPESVMKSERMVKGEIFRNAHDKDSLGVLLCIYRAKAIGFDVSSEERQYRAELDFALFPFLEEECIGTYAAGLAMLKGLDYKVDDQVKSTGVTMAKRLKARESEGNWSEYTSMASQMKRLGMGVPEGVEKHRASILDTLSRFLRQETICSFAEMAAEALDLGLLTPVRGGLADKEMPPLKRIRS